MPSSACPPPTDTHTLSLHDALPISDARKPSQITSSALSGSGRTPSDQKFVTMSVIATTESYIAMSTYWPAPVASRCRSAARIPITPDRKSTRLNSSHPSISYAVFCLSAPHRHPHSFPTRRSSDLGRAEALADHLERLVGLGAYSQRPEVRDDVGHRDHRVVHRDVDVLARARRLAVSQRGQDPDHARSEEHTSELQSPVHLVCRLLLVRPPPTPTLFPYTTLFRSRTRGSPRRSPRAPCRARGVLPATRSS